MARVILEGRLAEVTTASTGDFYDADDRGFAEKAHAETGDWHKLVLSYITKAWIRK